MLRFKVLDKLGEGSMGVVFEARDRQRDMTVAYKTARHGDPTSLFRLKHEFRALVDVDHPNLVAMYELLQEQERWFFTMEMVQGQELMEYLHERDDFADEEDTTDTGLAVVALHGLDDRQRASLLRQLDGAPEGEEEGEERPWRQAVSEVVDLARLRASMGQLANGLHALHRAGLVHRDLKPANVRVTAEGRVVLIDFGVVARLRGGRQVTAGGARVGSPAYMAPEQRKRQPITPAADWYAFGVMLFEALTGQLPFSGERAHVMSSKTRVDAPRPSELIRGVPADLERLCVGLLQREPERRPSASEVLACLGGVARESAVVAASGPVACIGRSSQLARIRRAYRAVARGEAHCLLLSGSAGSGKSRIVEQAVTEMLQDRLGREPPMVLRGRCDDRESVSYKAFDGIVDELTQALRQLPEGERNPVMPEHPDDISALFATFDRVPTAGTGRPVLPTPPAERMARATRALRALLGGLAVVRPLVLCIEDLQWADRDSLAFLRTFCQQPPVPGVLLLMTARSDQWNHELGETVRGLAQQAHFSHLQVGRLSEEHARELLGAMVASGAGTGTEPGDQEWHEIAGEPLFVADLAHLINRPSASESQEDITLENALRRRMASVSGEARMLLTVVAVHGQPAPLSLVRAASALPGEVASRALRSLRHVRLLRVVASEGEPWLDCYHDRIRAVALGRLSGVRIRVLRSQIAAVHRVS